MSTFVILGLCVWCFVLGAALGVFGHQLYWMGLFDNLTNPDEFDENDIPHN